MFESKKPATPASPALTIEQLKAVVVPPRKPAALQAAEARVVTLRRRKIALAQEQMAAHQADLDNRFNGGKLSAKTLELTKELDDLELEIRKARDAVSAAREAFADKFLEALGPHTLPYRAFLLDLVDLVDHGLQIGSDVEKFARANELPVPRVIREASTLYRLLRNMRAVLNQA